MIFVISTVFCSIVTCFLIVDFCVRKFTTYGLAKSIPGPYMYPIIGATNFLFSSSENKTLEIAMKFCEAFPNGFPYWTFGFFIYHCYSAESLEKILTNPKHIEKSLSYKFLNSFLGTGLLTSTGEKWFNRRKLLTPAFHFSVLNGFQGTFNDQTSILISSIRETELNRSGGTHLQQLISRFTLNTICESAMGVKLRRIDELDDYRNQINRIGKLHVERITIPWMVNDWVYNTFGKGKIEHQYVKEVHDFTGSIIDKKRKQFRSDNRKKDTSPTNDIDSDLENKKRFAMLDTLLHAEEDHRIDAGGIQEEVDTFVFEGFDTTMTAITFILFMLASHQDVQQRLYEEIHSVVHKDDYNHCKYLDCVIKETIRLYPPVPFIGRVLGEETEIDNVKLPAKTFVHILINVLHRDPRYFNDPEKFDPNRFLDSEFENGAKHPFAYLPFSASHRNCIGQKFAMMELRTVVSEIVRNFVLKPITRVDEIYFGLKIPFSFNLLLDERTDNIIFLERNEMRELNK
ncbi:putative cytochrome P450 4ac1 [Pseudolycoriella hygida]|uniref:Cytochrome P450 4ac1 n=1 Tax=Pseudolycoriella hygida TaxID=35572 RepID=A0A9Q0S664_9DIPT|nr:putative cytochrome P450 4ac1 [Pseudolycoriella hygida]